VKPMQLLPRPRLALHAQPRCNPTLLVSNESTRIGAIAPHHQTTVVFIVCTGCAYSGSNSGPLAVPWRLLQAAQRTQPRLHWDQNQTLSVAPHGRIRRHCPSSDYQVAATHSAHPVQHISRKESHTRARQAVSVARSPLAHRNTKHARGGWASQKISRCHARTGRSCLHLSSTTPDRQPSAQHPPLLLCAAC
jgi:hypothetical protein